MAAQLDNQTARNLQATALGIVQGDPLIWDFLMEATRRPARVEDDPAHYGCAGVSSDETPEERGMY